MYNENSIILKEAKELLKGDNDIKYQMIYLSDCMPPLNRRNITKKLDDWQKEVINGINNKESILICTPTSSGKTILTTTLTINYNKILFIVPNDALVRQVGAIFYQATQGCVSMICKTLYYMSPYFDKERVRDDICSVVIGTADWIERKLPDLYDTYDYIVFDEIHTINDIHGGATERLMKYFSGTPMLILSATIGNPKDLSSYLNDKICKTLKVIFNRKRFINLQRYTIIEDNDESECVGSGEGNSKLKMIPLNPMSFLDSHLLEKEIFSRIDMALTPRDCYDLWEIIQSTYTTNVSDLNPIRFFSKFEGTRITLDQSRQYEVFQNIFVIYLKIFQMTRKD